MMRKRILIVGAGAAGTAAAFSLGKHPEKFDVQVWEKAPNAGGAASAELIEGTDDLWVNDAVQGGCMFYRSVLNIMSECGFSVSPEHVALSFGKGCTAWTNYTTTELTVKHREEIKRFGRTLRFVNKFDFLFVFMPFSKLLRLCRFSDSFCHQMVYPLAAIFFGAANQTPNVSAAVIAKVFLESNARLFDYDPERLLSQRAEVFSFPNLRKMYNTIMSKSNAVFHLQRAVSSVTRRNGRIFAVDESSTEEVFDEIIFACSAEAILKIVIEPSFLEHTVLGNVMYSDSLLITHEDKGYMANQFELNQGDDHIFVRTNPKNPSKTEMAFSLSNFRHLKGTGKNIYQTLFVDDDIKVTSEDVEIDKEKILLVKQLRHFTHRWQHFTFTVLLMRYLQGRNQSWYCGSYTLVDAHEFAVLSGLAAACRLGADYPFSNDKIARMQFEQFMLISHGRPPRYGCNMGTIKSMLIAPLMCIFAAIVLFIRFLMKCLGKHP